MPLDFLASRHSIRDPRRYVHILIVDYQRDLPAGVAGQVEIHIGVFLQAHARTDQQRRRVNRHCHRPGILRPFDSDGPVFIKRGAGIASLPVQRQVAGFSGLRQPEVLIDDRDDIQAAGGLR